MTIWILIISFFAILSLIALINYKLNKEFKIETSWLALSLAPVVIWLITTQQLSEFSGFGLAFKLNKVTATPVSLQLDGDLIQPEAISSDAKEGIGKIDLFKRDRVAAITLEVGKRGYYLNSAIQQYLRELTPLSFFKYVLFLDKDSKYRGMINGDKLLEEMRSRNIDLVDLLEANNITGISGVNIASITSGSSKQAALQLMDTHSLSELPVVNDSGHFIGVVERNKITSSIVAQLVSSTD